MACHSRDSTCKFQFVVLLLWRGSALGSLV